MKPLTVFFATMAAVLACPATSSAQLLPDQRLHDFQNLAALYAKRYAPYEWKRQALGFDLYDLKPWLDRVRAAKDDLEFFEIQAEYVAGLQDTHASFSMTSSFRANLGITVDIYDGKVLIESINRGVLPAATYPFQVGDEIVSVDNVSSEDWIKRVSTWRRWGNPASTRRMAAAQITFRNQTTFPRAHEIGETAKVQIRRAGGDLETYDIRWTKTGVPVTKAGPVPSPRSLTAEEGLTSKAAMETANDLQNYALPAHDPVRSYVNGIGARTPIFSVGLPANFVQRLGRAAADFHFSGTFSSGGLTLGFLRIPSFTPPLTQAVNELRTEIEYFQANTDGLIIDVMRNPGGGCYMLDLAAALIPHEFYFFGEHLRPTQSVVNSYEAQFEAARASPNTPAWVIATYQSYRDEVKAAFEANRGTTAPIPACRQLPQTSAPIMEGNAPAPVNYKKPMIVLIDEFSISAADIFPAMLQDNGRALLVGMRTSGGGGAVSSWPTGLYSESIAASTNSLVVRKTPIRTAEYPAAPFVENIGARPDIVLDYMTRENLLNGGRTFVNRFTEIAVEQIRIAASANPFTIADRGGTSLTAVTAPAQQTIGYGRIETIDGAAVPAGLAILSSRQNNILVTEAAIPATPAIRTGRIYAEIAGAVNTGVAIANPNSEPATVSFYFTGAAGNTSTTSTVIAANGQISAYFDQAPFNAARPFMGTWTFNSTAPVAVIALRSFANERGEPLLTTLPVTDLAAPAETGPGVFPQYADGDGWTTQVVLVNPTDSLLSGTIQFFEQSGAPSTLPGASYSIPPRSSQKLGPPATPRPLRVGSVRIVPSGTGARPAGIAVFAFAKDGVTAAEAGVPAAGTGSTFRMYAEASGNFDGGGAGSVQTGIAIANHSTSPATVTLEVTLLDGSSTGLTGSIAVPANGQVSRFLNQIPGFAALPSPFRGVVRLSSPSPVAITGLRGRYNERGDFLITNIPAINEAAPPSYTESFFPHFVEGSGYTTQFILFSGSPGQRSTGTLRFVSPAGNAMTLPLR